MCLDVSGDVSNSVRVLSVCLQSGDNVSFRVRMESRGHGDSKECLAQKEMKDHGGLRGLMDRQGCRYKDAPDT